ncbi:MAG: hypothetical protein IJF92_02480 [Bacilli bacterium]|nr:hypothetical protein [Bacilli bacterium]
MSEAVQDFRQQNLDNYKKAVIEVLKNNSKTLVDEDIGSLIKKPPLNSMDVIKTKFLSIAKRYKIVLNAEKLDKLLEDYREELMSKINLMKKDRVEEFKSVVDSFKPKTNTTIIKFSKKDFLKFNKEQKKTLKKNIEDSINKKIVNNVNNIFTKNTDQSIINNINIDIDKYLNKTYKKQLLEDIDIKILVKDTTLINSVKEQGERYIFTKNNSYLLDKKQEKSIKAR